MMRMQMRSRGHDSRIIKHYSKELFLLYSLILQIIQFDAVNIFFIDRYIYRYQPQILTHSSRPIPGRNCSRKSCQSTRSI